MSKLAGLLIVVVALGCGREDVAPDFDARVIVQEPDAAAGDEIPEECSLIENDCPESLPKCTVIQGAAMVLETECVEVTGSKVEGDSCTRMFGEVGRDDCDVGLFCSGLAIAPMGETQPRVCRRYCIADEHCTGAGGDTCLEFGFDDPTMPGDQDHPGVEGLCVPSCILFEDCGTGLTCSLNVRNAGTLFGMCRPTGSVMAGGTCASSNECGPDMNCLFDQNGMGTCAQLCDDAHPCPAGACVTMDASGPFNLPNNGGFCGG